MITLINYNKIIFSVLIREIRRINLIKVQIFFFLLLLSFYSYSQDKTKFNLSGTVAENEILALDGVTVIVYEDFDKIAEQTTSPNGKFSFALDMNKDYTIEFSKPLFVAKKISVNTELPDKCKKKTFDFADLPKISLFKIVEGVNYKIYKKPYMYFQYSEKCKFSRDEEHYARVAPLLKKLEDDITAQQKETAKLSTKEAEEKKQELFEQYKTEVKKEEEKEKFKSLSSDEKYKELIKQADAFWNNGNYEAAKKKYLDALNLNAGDLYAEMQLIRIENLIAEQKKKQKQQDDLAQKHKKENVENQKSLKEEALTLTKSISGDFKKEQKKTEALLLKISDDSAVKAASAQLEKQREIERANDMKSILAHAQAKRIFLEEIADSKIKMKKAIHN